MPNGGILNGRARQGKAKQVNAPLDLQQRAALGLRQQQQQQRHDNGTESARERRVGQGKQGATGMTHEVGPGYLYLCGLLVVVVPGECCYGAECVQ